MRDLTSLNIENNEIREGLVRFLGNKKVKMSSQVNLYIFLLKNHYFRKYKLKHQINE